MRMNCCSYQNFAEKSTAYFAEQQTSDGFCWWSCRSSECGNSGRMWRFVVPLHIQFVERRTSNIWRPFQHCNILLAYEGNGYPQLCYVILVRKEGEDKIEEECTISTEDPISTAVATENERLEEKARNPTNCLQLETMAAINLLRRLAVGTWSSRTMMKCGSRKQRGV